MKTPEFNPFLHKAAMDLALRRGGPSSMDERLTVYKACQRFFDDGSQSTDSKDNSFLTISTQIPYGPTRISFSMRRIDPKHRPYGNNYALIIGPADQLFYLIDLGFIHAGPVSDLERITLGQHPQSLRLVDSITEVAPLHDVINRAIKYNPKALSR